MAFVLVLALAAFVAGGGQPPPGRGATEPVTVEFENVEITGE
jgi:hypothetical protein